MVSTDAAKRKRNEEDMDEDQKCPFSQQLKKPKLEIDADDFDQDMDNGNQLAGASQDKTKEDATEFYDDDDGADFEVDELLEADVDDALKNEKGEYEVYSKVVLQRQPKDLFNVLPDGWIEITHESGCVVYLHKPTRVCTFGRPYFLGPGSARHHKVPQSAIPCLYQRTLEEQEKADQLAHEEYLKDLSEANDDESKTVRNQINAPMVKVCGVKETAATDLSPEDLHNYAARAFAFKTVHHRKYKTWSKARQHFKEKKKISNHINNLMKAKNADRPRLPSDTQIITLPVIDPEKKSRSKEFRMNPNHKSALTLLHDYVQKLLKSTVDYDFFDSGDSVNPYCAVAKIRCCTAANEFISNHTFRERFAVIQEEYKARLTEDGKESQLDKFLKDMIVVGRGLGSSKKAAKMAAAASAVRLLIPNVEFNFQNDGVDPITEQVTKDEPDLAIFDMLKIVDSSIPQLSIQTGHPTPYAILQECLSKCATLTNCTLETIMTKISHASLRVTLRLGDQYEVSHEGGKQQDVRQMAALKMLEKIYPNLTNYGSILRLHGTYAKQKVKSFRLETKAFQRSNMLSRVQVSGNNKVDGTDRFLEAVKQHMVKFAEDHGVKTDDIYERSSPLTKEKADELTIECEKRSKEEGDPFLEKIPKVYDLKSKI